MALERTGLHLVLEGQRAFTSGVQAAQRVTDRLDGSFRKLADKSRLSGLRGMSLGNMVPKGALDRLTAFTGQFDKFGMAIGRISPQLGGAIHPASGLTAELGKMAGAMSLTAAGALALGAALIGLGMRGAAMTGVVQAFDAVSQRASMTANTLLGDLRKASAGTINDMTLLRQTNMALAGAGPQLAAALGKGGGLAGMLEIARAQSRATGESVDYLFQSLVSGVKRSTPMLIDNTGLVLKVGEANEAYAKSIGKAVGQLTAEEKQIALLNATLAAGREGVQLYGQTALQASEYIARIQTTITNTLDRLALSVQPIFTLLVAIADTIVSAIAWPLQNIVIPIFYELANTIFGPLLTAFNLFKSAIGDTIAPVLNLIHRWVVLVVGVLRYLGRAFQWIAEQAAKLFAPIKDIVKKYIVEPFVKFLDPVRFAQSAGRTFGAYAEGILWAANTLIFPAVIAIAEFIADFLMGFSPPPKGPLSNIDKGGSNVMAAWLEGFTGVSLAPVSDMMGRVNDLLGDITLLTHDKVTKLLEQLDEQLQPFIDNLEIAKAYAEAVLEPLKQAEDAMRKRLDAAVQAFTKGGMDAEAVRALDRQNEALAEQKELWEGMTAEAEYQLALKKSEQAVLRAMLAIQERRTRPEDALAGSAEKAAKAVKEAAGSGGGGETAESVGGGAGGAFPDLTDSVGEFLGVTNEEIDKLFGDMGTAFADAFMTPGVQKQMNAFTVNQMKLQTAIKKIGDSPGFQKISKAFDDVFGDGEDSLKTKVQGFVDTFEEKWNGLFGETGTIGTAWDNFKSNIKRKWDSVFGDGGFVSKLSFSKVIETFTNTFGWPDGSLWSSLDTLASKWEGAWKYPDGSIWEFINNLPDNIRKIFTEDIPGIFDGFSLDNIKQKFFAMFGDENGGIRSILNWFKVKINALFKPDEGGVLKGIFGLFSLDNILNTFKDMFSSEEGGLRGVLNSFMSKVEEFFRDGAGGTMFDILAKVGGFFGRLLAAPVEGVINAVISGFESLVNAFIDGVNWMIEQYNKASGPIWDALTIDKLDHINLGEVKLIPDQKLGGPATPVPGAASGGLFGSGLLKVHAGEVLAASGANRLAVFPRRWVNAMDRLANAMVPYRAGSAPAPVVNVQGGGGGVTNNNTFNVHSSQSMRLAMARSRAFGA